MRTEPLPAMSAAGRVVSWVAMRLVGVTILAFAWVWCGMAYAEVQLLFGGTMFEPPVHVP